MTGLVSGPYVHSLFFSPSRSTITAEVMGNRKTSRRNTQPAQVFTKETFTGLNIGSDGKHPTTRHKEPTPNPSGKEKRIIKREREQKRLHDMYRQNILQVEQAIRNKSECLYGVLRANALMFVYIA